MIAADIHQTACLDKCNRIVSNFIASPSFRCIYVMTRTLNPAVVSPPTQMTHSSPRAISKLRRRASVPNFELRVYHRNPYVDHKRNPLNRNIFLGVTCVLRPPIGATAERLTAGTSYGRCGAAGTQAAAGCCRHQPPA